MLLLASYIACNASNFSVPFSQWLNCKERSNQSNIPNVIIKYPKSKKSTISYFCTSQIMSHIVWKSSKNVSFEFLKFGIFHQLKLTCLVTLFDAKLQLFKNSSNETFSVIFKHSVSILIAENLSFLFRHQEIAILDDWLKSVKLDQQMTKNLKPSLENVRTRNVLSIQ